MTMTDSTLRRIAVHEALAVLGDAFHRPADAATADLWADALESYDPGVITTADIQTKGTGSYAADYVNWCRIAHLLQVHAPGWQFQLVADANGNHVHRAPAGTGYLMGQFTSPEGFVTTAFPQALPWW